MMRRELGVFVICDKSLDACVLESAIGYMFSHLGDSESA